MIAKIVILVSLLSAVFAEDVTKFKLCQSSGVISRLAVQACSDSDKLCILHKGSSCKIEVEFTSPVDATQAEPTLTGNFGIIPLPFPSFLSGLGDACKDSKYGLTCPIKAGQTYTYTAELPVKSFYPSGRLVVEWQLENENGDTLFCFQIPAGIQ